MAKIGILTTFASFNPWYSLTGIVKDQARMLREHGHEVFIFVNEQFAGSEADFPGVTLLREVPFTHLHDYQSNEPLKNEHHITAHELAKRLTARLPELGISIVLTHDIAFTGWNKPYAIGLQRIGNSLPDIMWFHWIHSIPTRFSDWWRLDAYGSNHKLVYPNKSDALRVAENYRTSLNNIVVIPHIKDIRVMFDFPKEACDIIAAYPALMQADIVQVYPASSDRFTAKRVAEVIRVFGNLKNSGQSVCLFVANQWATTSKHETDIAQYYRIGESFGLVPGKELIFSSTMDIPGCDYKVGVPSNVLNYLMMLGNLFVFPTDHETFGLVLPEASLASGALCVLNRSLLMQIEVGGHNGLYFDFGSYTNQTHIPDPGSYFRDMANIILRKMHTDAGIATRTFMRKSYNYDRLYRDYYGPIISTALAAINGSTATQGAQTPEELH